MGGGKRGRTQRRHFKQGRENVWKHNNKKTRSDGDPSSDPNPTDPYWQPFATQNLGFEEYYKEQGIVSDEEWEEFLGFLRKPLPAAFRINSSGQFFQDIRSQLKNDFVKSLEAEINNDIEMEAIRPLPWYPENLAWHLNFSRMQLRKNQTLERFHEFLKQENEIGNITRQEAVSMVPPLFLDVLPDHHVLDMCAAPGSKTFQLLEIIHQSTKPGSLPKGMVIANDVDVQRCNLLIHQTKRMCTANLIVTNHEAQHFPGCYLARDRMETSKEVQGEPRKDVLQFDRVLCDVPCSGDGTLRKAPDIWRKWNAGMGNGVHRLQVEIAMRGIALLKVGGRMVYSTCSMNPVENEAVVAEVLRRCEGSVELLDVSNELPALVRRPGLKKWKVRDKGVWLPSYEDCPMYRRNVIVPSMFTSEQSCKDSHILNDAAQEVIETNGGEISEEGINSTVEQESNSDMMVNNATLADVEESPIKTDEISSKSASKEDPVVGLKMETSTFPLERCMRLLPHDQNTGAFFVAVLQKLSHMPDNRVSRLNNGTNKTPVKEVENLEDEKKSSEDVPRQDHHILPEEASFTNLISEQSLAVKTESPDTEEAETCNNEESGHAGIKGAKGRLQAEGKWKGIDPVVFFRDETAINSIRSFYGISESFPLDGYLVARNSDTSHVKRIYYVSRSVHDVLLLNFQVGQRLKITSLGLKIFERQTTKEGSQCAFRVSSEGLPLLLPYMSKQVLRASLVDLQHLLQYRVIKFGDFVDAKFGEKVSGLMPGCCVLVLNEGNLNADAVQVDASAIAIICWKGKTNLSIMVTQMDAQELLARLSARFGSGKVDTKEEEIDEILE